ncbi:hypothetical protein EZV62_005219 [Acer yangbiense]|uniref:Secreted protein n=1 Tax=Acer yangbiense TaxID=1000413 RepID=A0A5C7IN62_9ROSI|nr:hypothetical protein EZV62_005219 [Acer yangbiense]
MFFIFFTFLLLVHNNHATNIPDNHDEAPSPQSQPEGQNHTMSAGRVAVQDVRRHNTRSRACSFAISAVPSACVCLLVFMETRSHVLATITGRPREEDPNVLRKLEYNPL